MSLSWYLLEPSANYMVEVIAFGISMVEPMATSWCQQSNVGGPTVMFQKDIISKL
jgi:hypothetical protein